MIMWSNSNENEIIIMKSVMIIIMKIMMIMK